MAGKIIHKKKTNLSADKAGQRTEPITKECCGETEQGGKQRAGRPMTKENESYEDPDQTPLSGKEADMQIDLWSCLSKMSAPYSETMCPWARTLTRGDYARMERLLEGIEAEALTHLLEKRESNERISAIVHVILGASATFRSHPSFYKDTKFLKAQSGSTWPALRSCCNWARRSRFMTLQVPLPFTIAFSLVVTRPQCRWPGCSWSMVQIQMPKIGGDLFLLLFVSFIRMLISSSCCASLGLILKFLPQMESLPRCWPMPMTFLRLRPSLRRRPGSSAGSSD